MSNFNLNLNRTALDTVAVFVPNNLSLSQTPLVLSTGTGVDNFISFETPKDYINVDITMNGELIESVSNVKINGTMTFHPQSTSLIGIREIQEAQIKSKQSIPGTLSITNPSSLIQRVYRNFRFTNVITGANTGRSLDMVSVRFTCLPPQEISLGGTVAIGGALVRSLT